MVDFWPNQIGQGGGTSAVGGGGGGPAEPVEFGDLFSLFRPMADPGESNQNVYHIPSLYTRTSQLIETTLFPGTVTFSPIVVTKTTTYDRSFLYIRYTGSVPFRSSFGLFDSDENNLPLNRLQKWDISDSAFRSEQRYEFLYNATLEPGVYWFGTTFLDGYCTNARTFTQLLNYENAINLNNDLSVGFNNLFPSGLCMDYLATISDPLPDVTSNLYWGYDRNATSSSQRLSPVGTWLRVVS